MRTKRPSVALLGDLPSEAVGRLSWTAFVHNAGALDRAVEVLGEDRMVLGSDWPFPTGPAIRLRWSHRGERFVHRIASDNAAAALRPHAPE